MQTGSARRTRRHCHAGARRRLDCALFGLWAVLIAAPRPAACQNRRFTLSWVRTSQTTSCISAVELARRIEALVGPVFAPASAAEVSIEGRIERVQDAYSVHVVVSDARGGVLGERTLERRDLDCRKLDAAIAFVIAVTIDPDHALAELPGSLSDEEDPEAALLGELQLRAAPPLQPAQIQRVESAAPKPQPAPTPPLAAPAWRYRVAVGGAGGLAVSSPPLAAGLAAELGLFDEDWDILLRGVYWLPAESKLPLGGRVTVRTFQVAIAGCHAVLRTPGVWGLELCVALLGSPIVVTPDGFGEERSRFRVGAELSVRSHLHIVGPIDLALTAAGQTVWPRERFLYEWSRGSDTVYQTGPGMISLILSTGLSF